MIFTLPLFKNYGRAEADFDADPAACSPPMTYGKAGGLEAAAELPSDSWERIELLNMLKDAEATWPGVAFIQATTDFQYSCRAASARAEFSRRYKFGVRVSGVIGRILRAWNRKSTIRA